MGGPSFNCRADLMDTSPGIFTTASNGTDLGGIIDWRVGVPSINSADDPAPKGSAVEIFATGAGLWDPSMPGGIVLLYVLNVKGRAAYVPIAPVSVTIGGQPAGYYTLGRRPTTYPAPCKSTP